MTVRCLLLQVRNVDDPMLAQEVRCFARALRTRIEQVQPFDLLTNSLAPSDVEAVEIVLIGGSGEYSAAAEGEWLDRALDSLRLLHSCRKPTFASCWGFQAMARALGGEVVHDLERAEVGTHRLFLTEEGKTDPIFGSLDHVFHGQMGHEDCVSRLPPGTTLLASSEKVVHQAYRFDDRPIYCTQFHPELNCADLEERVRRYPEYIRRIARREPEEFVEMIHETLETEALLRRFVEQVTLA